MLYALEGYLGLDDPPLDLHTEIPPDATVVVKRVPGEIFRPFACLKSQSEDEKIRAWINHVADTWRSEVREANRGHAQARRRRAIGIPSSMLRRAETEEEKDRALQGIGGVLVVKRDNEKPFNVFDVM